jgi:hypothetical protein
MLEAMVTLNTEQLEEQLQILAVKNGKIESDIVKAENEILIKNREKNAASNEVFYLYRNHFEH